MFFIFRLAAKGGAGATLIASSILESLTKEFLIILEPPDETLVYNIKSEGGFGLMNVK